MDEGETLTGVAITPGTTFMLDLTHSLAYFCCTKVGEAGRWEELWGEVGEEVRQGGVGAGWGWWERWAAER